MPKVGIFPAGTPELSKLGKELLIYYRGMEGRRPSVLSVYLAAADEEYSLRLPPNTKRFTVWLREGDAEFLMAFEQGKVGAVPVEPYVRIPTGGQYWDEGINYTGKLYFSCPVAGKTIQVIAWD